MTVPESVLPTAADASDAFAASEAAGAATAVPVAAAAAPAIAAVTPVAPEDVSVAPTPAAPPAATPASNASAAPDPAAQEYQQAAEALLDAASLVGRVLPGTRAGRAVNMAMPVARSVVANVPQIAKKAAPVVSKVAEAAPEVAEKAATGLGKGLGKLGRFVKGAASQAVGGVVDGAKQAVVEYKRERDS